MRRWLPLELILGILLIFLIWKVYYVAMLYSPANESGEAVAQHKAEKVKIKLPAFTAFDAKVVLEKNLFHPDRNADVLKPPPPAKAGLVPPKKPDMALKGIVTGPDGELVALIQTDRAMTKQYRKGDTFDNVEVVDIKPNKVYLKWMNEDLELTMWEVKTITPADLLKGRANGMPVQPRTMPVVPQRAVPKIQQ